MLLPSPTAGTLCLRWISWRSLKGKLSTVDRCSRNPPCGWITLALDCAVTPPTQQHPEHLPGVPGPDNFKCYHVVLPRHGCLAPCPGPLDPDPEGGGDFSQPVLLTDWQSNSLMIARSSSHCPTRSYITSTSHASPPRDPTPSFSAEPPCPQVCPNKLLGENQKKKNNNKK